ncbi:hypothetical protein M2103_002076 [Ereboglobus sp. PH5-5]|nr:hypothetical protein [Ereboglobus sp. PH5-10]MDF9833843.1 hypothetical protein [Ereboglobus sp. PH5-5]
MATILDVTPNTSFKVDTMKTNTTMKTSNILKYLLLSACIILLGQQAHACEECGEGGGNDYDPCSNCGDAECGGDCSSCGNCGGYTCPGTECMGECPNCGNAAYDCSCELCPNCGGTFDDCNCGPCPNCGSDNCNTECSYPTCRYCDGEYCMGECMEWCPLCDSDGECITTCPWWIDPDDIDPDPGSEITPPVLCPDCGRNDCCGSAYCECGDAGCTCGP